MGQHKLPKDSISGYQYNATVIFVKNIQGVLEDEFFDRTTDGMKGMVSSVSNILTRLKANNAIIRANVKCQSILGTRREAMKPRQK